VRNVAISAYSTGATLYIFDIICFQILFEYHRGFHDSTRPTSDVDDDEADGVLLFVV